MHSIISCVDLDGSSTDNFMTFVMDFPPLVICCLGALLMFLKDFKLENILVLIQ